MVEEEGGALGLEEKAELSPEKPAVKKWVARPLTTVTFGPLWFHQNDHMFHLGSESLSLSRFVEYVAARQPRCSTMGRSHATLVGQSFSVINIIWFLEMALMLITLEINTISGFCYWDSFMSELTKGDERYLSNRYGFELLLACLDKFLG